jgi:hypothetical protein
MSNTNKVTWEILRVLNSATMSSATTFYAIGGPLLFPSYKLKIVNNSSVLITVSIDGINNHDVFPSTTSQLYDESQAQLSTAVCPAVPQGTQFYAQSATTGTGNIYVVSQYLIQS